MTDAGRYFDSVREAYVDLLLLEELWSSEPFRSWWLSHFDFPNPDQHEFRNARHSVTAGGGESDLILEVSDTTAARWAVLIEDKVDAQAQPRQGERYRLRGDSGILEGAWDKFVTCIVGRDSYLTSEPDVSEYDVAVSLETIRDFLAASVTPTERRDYKVAVLNAAIDPIYGGYVKKEDDVITAFLHRYAEIAREHGGIRITSPLRGGPRSLWIYFEVPVTGMTLIHKATKGFVDLHVSQKARFVDRLDEPEGFLDSDMTIAQTGKSRAIRIHVPAIDKARLDEARDVDIQSGVEVAARLAAVARTLGA